MTASPRAPPVSLQPATGKLVRIHFPAQDASLTTSQAPKENAA